MVVSNGRNTRLRVVSRPRTRKINHQGHHHLTLISLLLLVLLLHGPHIITSAQDDDVCNFQNDASCDYKFDKECDREFQQCANGDCFDCDPCLGLSLDCNECQAAGCFYCPFDGVCQSTPRGAQFWSFAPATLYIGCPQSSDWTQECGPASPDNVYTDPLYDTMKWSFDLINVEEVWRQGITGAGIHVRVNDDGVDANHAEFLNNFDIEHSCESYLPTDFERDHHGTGCASLIGAIKDNDSCSVGIAPDVTISACNGPPTLNEASDLFMTHLEVVDVISNSWGPLPCKELPDKKQLDSIKQQLTCPFSPDHPKSPCTTCGADFDQVLTSDCEEAIKKYCSTFYELDSVACGEYLDIYVDCSFHSLSTTNEVGFAQVMEEGRAGKGVIITFAGGNDYKIGVDVNGDGMVNSRYTIGVAAVGQDGLHASYSTVGAAIFVAAPGGDVEAISNNIVALPGGGCHDITVGTSFATPVVSGVAALVLQANFELGWRDVQGIIALTSQRNDFEDESWHTNSAGMSHSYKYGFGVIDALAAVNAARTWQNWETEKQVLAESGTIDLAIPDNTESPVLAQLTITETDVQTSTSEIDIAMESVVVYLDIGHASRGDLQIVLVSPGGTRSILAPGKRPENTVLQSEQRWKLMTLRSWGESPIGTWTLEISDEKAGLLEECIELPWEYATTDEYFQCSSFADLDCTDTSRVPIVLQQAEFNGITMFEACCECGGGQNAADIVQQLRSWRMITYGHKISVTTVAPTASAANPQTALPTVAAGNPQTPVNNPGVGLPPVDDATCSFREETCPFESLFDSTCDADADCIECFDCDSCQIYSATSCATCVQNGCVWCPGDAICLSVALDAQYWETYTDRKTTSCPATTDWRNTCEASETNVFQDPLYDSMAWSYKLINVEPVWREGITGAGVHVRVNDDGVDATHPEFAGKFDVANSCTEYLPSDPATNQHGTACASIIAGSTNNECAVGIAPNAAISACKFPVDDDPLEATMFLTSLDAIDISSNSYGPVTCQYTKSRRQAQETDTQCPFPEDHELSPCRFCDEFWGPILPNDCLTAVAVYCKLYYEDSQSACIDYMDYFVSCAYHILPSVMQEAWTSTITEGRNGLGVIYVVAAGNEYSTQENTNANGYANSRFTMAISAVGKDGKHASYSTTGTSVFMSAPGGDRESVSNNLVAKVGGGCHDITIGSSFAAPVVSGVVALLLEVNPNLSWRDVQGVLAETAQKVDELVDASWTTNAASISHSSKYGFGIVDAFAAVTAARTWDRWGSEVVLTGDADDQNTEIPDNAFAGIAGTMQIQDSRNLTTESVVVFLDLTHPSRGDLEISITHGGTKSILSPGNRPLSFQLEEAERWKFLTYSHWGTAPQGDWTLSIIDQSEGLSKECLDYEWSLARSDGIYICASFDGATDCSDPEQVPDQTLMEAVSADGRTALEACCVCGGGLDLTLVPSLLKSWHLMVYAHDNDAVVASVAPTPVPATTAAPALQIPGTTIPPGGVPIPSGPPVPLAPVPLTEAIVLTIPPEIDNLPFVTNGYLSGAAPASSSSGWLWWWWWMVNGLLGLLLCPWLISLSFW